MSLLTLYFPWKLEVLLLRNLRLRNELRRVKNMRYVIVMIYFLLIVIISSTNKALNPKYHTRAV